MKKDKGWDIPIHVDGASGGFIAPFAEPDFKFDFRLEPVASINASGHKYGLVYPGVGWLIFRDRTKLPEDLIFSVDYLGGAQSTFVLAAASVGSSTARMRASSVKSVISATRLPSSALPGIETPPFSPRSTRAPIVGPARFDRDGVVVCKEKTAFEDPTGATRTPDGNLGVGSVGFAPGGDQLGWQTVLKTAAPERVLTYIAAERPIPITRRRRVTPPFASTTASACRSPDETPSGLCPDGICDTICSWLDVKSWSSSTTNS